MANPVRRLGARVLDAKAAMARGVMFCGRLARAVAALGPARLAALVGPTLAQLRFTGAQAVLLVAGVGVVIGGVAVFETVGRVDLLASEHIGLLLSAVVIRELGPLIVGAIVIGRTGTAIVAELGTMRLNRELAALEGFGIDPMQYLVIPRIVGVALATTLLTLVFSVATLAGAGLVAGWTLGMPPESLWGAVGLEFRRYDLAVINLEALAVGLCVAIVACDQGLAIRRSFTEIPQAVTRAVVAAFVAMFAVDVLISGVVHA